MVSPGPGGRAGSTVLDSEREKMGSSTNWMAPASGGKDEVQVGSECPFIQRHREAEKVI